jgi:rhodanese-related sulfurtransferase
MDASWDGEDDGRVRAAAAARSGPVSAIDAHLARARAHLDRVAPEDLVAEVRGGAVVIDIRPTEHRERDGSLPGAVVVDRNVLEWRLDPTSPYRLPLASGADVRYVVVCTEGYSSSLAAATLRELGLGRATDLVGGYRAWVATVARETR